MLVACGRPIVSTCYCEPFTVESEVELDCGTVYNGMMLARELYDSDDGPRPVIHIPDEEGSSFEDPWPVFRPSFDEAFKGTKVTVLLGNDVDCGTAFDPKHVSGCSKDGDILLPSSHQLSFGHELMHVYECRVGLNCHNTKHEGWKDNGYENFGIGYQYGATDGGLFNTAQLPEFKWTR